MLRTLSLASLGLLLLAGGCGSIQRPTASFKNMTVGDVSSRGFVMNVDVDVANPNAVAIPLTSADYSLSLGGVKVVDGAKIKPDARIPPTDAAPSPSPSPSPSKTCSAPKSPSARAPARSPTVSTPPSTSTPVSPSWASSASPSSTREPSTSKNFSRRTGVPFLPAPRPRNWLKRSWAGFSSSKPSVPRFVL